MNRHRGRVEIVAKDAIESAEAVLHSDFLSLLVRPAVIGDTHLEYAQAHLSDLGDNFRFKAKSIFLDRDALNNVPPEDFVARLHIGEVEIGKHVRHERQHAVTEGMPEVEDSVRS